MLVSSQLSSGSRRSSSSPQHPAASTAGRPAMRVVQALYWMQDMMTNGEERARIADKLQLLLADPEHGRAILDDLREGLSALPIWMQEFLRGLISPPLTER